MLAYSARRFVGLLPVLVLVSVITFALIQLVPGDPALALLGENGRDQKLYQVERHRLGLDQSLVVQYGKWAGHAATGDFGRSVAQQGRSVRELIVQSLATTTELAICSMLIAILVGIPLGVLAASRENSWVDVSASSLAVMGMAVPGFLVGILMLYLFSVKLGWLPFGGWVSPADDPVASAKSMVLPAFTLGVPLAAVLTRQMRSELVETLHQDFILTARAKGLSGRIVILRHAFKASLIPVLTVIGLQIGHLFGGVVVVETIFSLPGLGRLAVTSISNRDYPVLQAVVLVGALAVLFANFVTDILYGYIDPRVRYG